MLPLREPTISQALPTVVQSIYRTPRWTLTSARRPRNGGGMKSLRKRLKGMRKRAIPAIHDATSRLLRRPQHGQRASSTTSTVSTTFPIPSAPPSTQIPLTSEGNARHPTTTIAPSSTDKYLGVVASGCALAETVVASVPLVSAFSGIPAAIGKGAKLHIVSLTSDGGLAVLTPPTQDVRQIADDVVRERNSLALLAEILKGDTSTVAAGIQECVLILNGTICSFLTTSRFLSALFMRPV